MTTPEIINNDPDKLSCYSDHANDIRVCGVCGVCGSSEKNVIEHVLPEVPRFTGVDPVDAARKVMETGTGSLFDGILLDHFSASFVVAVHDQLNPENQQRLRSWPLVKAVDTCFRLANNNTKGAK